MRPISVIPPPHNLAGEDNLNALIGILNREVAEGVVFVAAAAEHLSADSGARYRALGRACVAAAVLAAGSGAIMSPLGMPAAATVSFVVAADAVIGAVYAAFMRTPGQGTNALRLLMAAGVLMIVLALPFFLSGSRTLAFVLMFSGFCWIMALLIYILTNIQTPPSETRGGRRGGGDGAVTASDAAACFDPVLLGRMNCIDLVPPPGARATYRPELRGKVLKETRDAFEKSGMAAENLASYRLARALAYVVEEGMRPTRNSMRWELRVQSCTGVALAAPYIVVAPCSHTIPGVRHILQHSTLTAVDHFPFEAFGQHASDAALPLRRGVDATSLRRAVVDLHGAQLLGWRGQGPLPFFTPMLGQARRRIARRDPVPASVRAPTASATAFRAVAAGLRATPGTHAPERDGASGSTGRGPGLGPAPPPGPYDFWGTEGRRQRPQYDAPRVIHDAREGGAGGSTLV